MKFIPLLEPAPMPEDLGREDHRFWSEEAESATREQLGSGLCALDDVVYARRAEALVDAVRGGAPLEALVALAAGLGVPWPPTRDGARPDALAPPLPTDADLLRMATDLAPDLPDTLPEVLLGPQAWWLDAANGSDRRLLVAALATAAFHTPHGYDRSPARFWLRTRPSPPPEARARLAAVDAAPHLPWRVVALHDGQVELAPMLPVQQWFAPGTPLPATEVAWVGGAGAVGGVVFARAVRRIDGWCLRCALGWPVAVDDGVVEEAAFRFALPHLLANRALRDADVWRAIGPPLQAWITATLLVPQGVGGDGGAAGRINTRRTFSTGTR